MGPPADPVLLVLLGLRLRGFGPADRVGDAVGVAPELARRTLVACAAQGWAVHREGRVGWSLTPAGRAEGERLLREELDGAGVPRAAVEEAYRRFRRLNGELLAVCTAWQVRDGIGPNDHGDEAYDAEVIERLAALHEAVVPTCRALAGALRRFGGYEARFSHALERVRAGDGDWFAGATVGSYHSVWFELHENLLATLGIDRSREGPSQDDD